MAARRRRRRTVNAQVDLAHQLLEGANVAGEQRGIGSKVRSRKELQRPKLNYTSLLRLPLSARYSIEERGANQNLDRRAKVLTAHPRRREPLVANDFAFANYGHLVRATARPRA